MHPPKAAVDDLQEELKVFISRTVTAENFDIVIPIMRKGLFLLDRVFHGQQKFKISLLESTEDRLSPGISLKGKKVLIIDDSSRTGRTINKAKLGLVANNFADLENIKTATYMKRKNCGTKIDYCCCEFDETSGTQLYAVLSAYFDSLCHQLDPDHLVISGILELGVNYPDQKTILQLLKNELSNFGSFYIQTDSMCRLWGRAKFSVVDLRTGEFGLGDYSPLWTEEGVFKVRFCIEPDWSMNVVPIFCPEIIPPGDKNPKNCVGLVTTRFCELTHDTDALCRDCISYNLTKNFSEIFIPVFKKTLTLHGLSYSVSSIGWSELELRYEEVQDTLKADFEASKKKMR
jgi:hypothetical protein